MFTRPGDNIILRLAEGNAFWVSWRSKYKRKDGYGYALECTHFRNEAQDKYLSSDLIKYAMYATTQIWGEIPKDGFITYVNSSKVNSNMRVIATNVPDLLNKNVKAQKVLLVIKWSKSY